MARVIVVAFEGAQTLDVTGPAEVFALASRLGGEGAYAVLVAATGGGSITLSSGIEVAARDLVTLRPGATDTVLVSGGGEGPVGAAVSDRNLSSWLTRAARSAGRVGSVCSGAFVLAASGLLDGKRAATHWSACDRLASFRPEVSVDRESIFVRDGKVWTSAGVTTGIDMALAMVEDDHGRALADRVASQLVLYARRPGYQAQFSDALVAQTDSSEPLGALVSRARAKLRDLDVPRLARLGGMSERTLHRRCHEHLGLTPAKLLERLRVEHAKALLTTTRRPVKSVAQASGFGGADRMRRAFERELGLGPREVRLLFDRRS